MQQEVTRRRIQKGLAHDLFAPGDADHAALEQRLDHATRVAAAQLLDLRPRDRLTIGDDRQRLEACHGQLVAAGDLEEAAQVAMKLRARHQAHAACNLVEHDAPCGRHAGSVRGRFGRLLRIGGLLAAVRSAIALQDSLERLLSALTLSLPEDAEQLVSRHRLGRHEEDGLEHRLHVVIAGHGDSPTRPSETDVSGTVLCAGPRSLTDSPPAPRRTPRARCGT